MSAAKANSAAVRAVEALMLQKFKTEPFQNLQLLSGKQPSSPRHGGTCSDKTLSFLSAASQAGFSASLHSGFIGGKEIHRLARVHVDGRVFFADVGNVWVQFPSTAAISRDPSVIRPRVGFGLGMRYNTPVGALVIDVGFNPDPRSFEVPAEPHFSVTGF